MWLTLALLTTALADSPLTTPVLYRLTPVDPLVERALATSELDEEMMAQLSRRWTPVARKVAIINALGWDVEGQSNAVRYLTWLDANNRRYNARELAAGEGLTGEEQLALGYLLAMDDYFRPQRALPLLDLAREASPRSRTTAWVHTLVLAQEQFPSDWCNVWTLAEAVRDDEALDDDLPPEVEGALLTYLSRYGEYCPPAPDDALPEGGTQPGTETPASDSPRGGTPAGPPPQAP